MTSKELKALLERNSQLEELALIMDEVLYAQTDEDAEAAILKADAFMEKVRRVAPVIADYDS